ncbi:PDDEXK nuclease domain-containing protein [Galactobacillus timonensis]|uniref:PDDEXK nuclease domain-containing protein n=1 Tax=Galactobacillus timonensis TaxID=2041840 RepID=UPI000C846FB5|nr:PDDEXK nuclease domain-containing protein [Galactobacillus timonensis]
MCGSLVLQPVFYLIRSARQYKNGNIFPCCAESNNEWIVFWALLFSVELKTGKFVPEYAGKMNFYLSVLDDQVKSEADNPSVGLILCRDKNKIVAEYALKDMTKPIGVSEYRLFDDVPKELQNTVPSLDDIESRIIDKYKCD